MPVCARPILPGLWLALLPHLGWPSGAYAQQADRPRFIPTDDVAVIYQLDGIGGADGPRKMQITYAEGGERVRIDYFRWLEAKYPYLALIFDRPANRLI